MADRTDRMDERAPLLSNSASGSSRRPTRRSTTQRLWGSSYHQGALLDQRPAWKKKVACAAILITEILERVAFYSLAGNLVLFLNKRPLEWVSYDASVAVLVFLGSSHLAAPLFGWIADSCLGRFWTVCLSLMVYIVGYSFLPLVASPRVDVARMCSYAAWRTIFYPGSTAVADVDDRGAGEGGPYCAWLVYFSLVIVALGSGGVKANIAPFGADQVMSEGPSVMRSFFNWFYWCINIGALTALGPIVYIQVEIEYYGFYLGYLIPGCCLATGLVVFIAASPTYLYKPPVGSVISSVARILHEACRSRRRRSKRANTARPGYELHMYDIVLRLYDAWLRVASSCSE